MVGLSRGCPFPCPPVSPPFPPFSPVAPPFVPLFYLVLPSSPVVPLASPPPFPPFSPAATPLASLFYLVLPSSPVVPPPVRGVVRGATCIVIRVYIFDRRADNEPTSCSEAGTPELLVPPRYKDTSRHLARGRRIQSSWARPSSLTRGCATRSNQQPDVASETRCCERKI